MSAVNLLQPILDGGVQRNNFFNGRLLSAEDLRAEQDANREQRGQIARALGDGIAWGLDVSIANAAARTVTVRPGLALNRHLDLLSLVDETQVTLVAPPASAVATGTGVFAQCEPPRASADFTGAGVYVLVAAPASGYRGSALVSDANTTAAGRGTCGARFTVEGLRFRLVPMTLARLTTVDVDPTLVARINTLLPPANDPSRERLRNLLAHLCYGTVDVGPYFRDPLAPSGAETTWAGWGAIDAMRDLGDITDCDVPLALVVLTTAGISLVDGWSVRRKLQGAGAVATWRGVAGPRRLAEGEAAFLQFQSQLEIVRKLATPSTIAASTYFDFLPPAGWLPKGTSGFDWRVFLGAHAPATTTPVDPALMRGIIERSFFDEPFSLASAAPATPVPLRVYEVLGDTTHVVFARTLTGAVRVNLGASTGASESVSVKLTPIIGADVHAPIVGADHVTIPDLEPGTYTVTFDAPDYEAVTPVMAGVVGGRTSLINTTLTPLANVSSILVDVLDSASGARLSSSDVVVKTMNAGAAVRATLQADGRWELADLPVGTYTVTVSATRYATAIVEDVGPTVRGSAFPVTVQIRHLDKEPPPECTYLARVERPVLVDTNICLVLAAAEFDQRYFFEDTRRVEATATDRRKYRIESRKQVESERGSRYVAATGEIVYRSEQRWKSMIPLRPATTQLAKWLASWADYLADDLSAPELAKASPEIVIDPAYRMPKSAAQVPDLPPAYAMFGKMAVPLMLRPKHGMTRRPVPADRQVIPWIPRETFEALDKGGIRTVNDLAWAWKELVVDATGDPPDTAPYLVYDAMSAVDTINKTRSYYPGLTPKMEAGLKAAGYPTDHALANAAPERIEKILGGRGFAVRIIHEARQIVPRESWSVETLPISHNQADALIKRGIDSQGELVERMKDSAGKAVIADAMGATGLSATKRDEILNPVMNEAMATLVRDAVALAPTVSLSKWSGIDGTTAAVLEASGITTVDALAKAPAEQVAAAGNLSTSAATSLVGKAQESSLESAHVESVIGLSSGTTTKLNEAFGGQTATLGGMLDKTATDIKGAFNNDEALAGSVLKGLTQGFSSRGMM